MNQPQQTEQEIREAARRWVYERLAFLSAAIWAVGTAILFFITVPYVEHPQRYIAVAMTIPILPAAIPWVFYGRISDAVARQRLAHQTD